MIRRRISAVLLSILLLAGCNGTLLVPADPTQAHLYPTVVVGSPLPTFSGVVDVNVTSIAPIASAPPATNNDGWTPIANGIGYRQMSFRTGNGLNVAILAARIDPTKATFKVYYTPGQGHTISEWQGALSSASLIVNGNYFDPQNKAIGLVVSDTVVYGSSATRDDAGLFQVASGLPRVRSLWLEPLSAGERFEQAAQGFPILAAEGQAAPITADLDPGSSRRTVIATDNLGFILILVTPSTGCTLAEIANWLVNSGLGVSYALNLDGGRSTALYMATGGPNQFTNGLGPTPIVLAAYSH